MTMTSLGMIDEKQRILFGRAGAANGNPSKTDRPRFDVTWFKEIQPHHNKEWLIEGAFGDGELSDVVGKPGSGKSVIVADAACHVAADMPWHGRAVKPGLVVYFAAERKGLTERRMAAFRKRYAVGDIDLVVVGGKLDLTRSLDDARALVKLINELEETCGKKCVWVILDTLSRTFGGGDQNASKDMGRYVQSADELLRRTGAHVTIIHHTPWNENRGKGAIDLDGAVDASFIVSKSGKNFSLHCDGTNDGDEGPIITFRLESVDLGKDDKGNVTTAPIVVPVSGKLVGMYDDEPSTKTPGGQSAVALACLRGLVEERGETPPPGSVGFPDSIRTVKRDDWQQAFVKSRSDAHSETALRAFRRAAKALIQTQAVEHLGEWVWPADNRT